MKFHNFLLKFAVVVDVCHRVSAGLYIRDGFENNRDRVPVLGRGYSPSTNNLMGTCIEAKTSGEPSFDYDYEFKSIGPPAGATPAGATGTGSYSSFASDWNEATQSLSVTARKALDEMVVNDIGVAMETTYQKYSIGKMVGYLYHNILDEGNSPLSVDASEILSRGDYIAFIQACGPYYINSIARRKEIITVFNNQKASGTSTTVEVRNSLGELIQMDVSGTIPQPVFTRLSTTGPGELKQVELSPDGSIVLATTSEEKLWQKDDGGLTGRWLDNLASSRSGDRRGGRQNRWKTMVADDDGKYVYAVTPWWRTYRKNINECDNCWEYMYNWWNIEDMAISGDGKQIYIKRPTYSYKWTMHYTESGRRGWLQGRLVKFSMNYDASDLYGIDHSGQMWYAGGTSHPKRLFERLDDPGWGPMMPGWVTSPQRFWYYRRGMHKIRHGWNTDEQCLSACNERPGAEGCMNGSQWWSTYWRGCFVFVGDRGFGIGNGYWYPNRWPYGGFKSWQINPPIRQWKSVSVSNDGSKVYGLDTDNRIWIKEGGADQPWNEFNMQGITNRDLNHVTQSSDGKNIVAVGRGGMYHLGYPARTTSTSTSVDSESLTITVMGFGLSLNQDRRGSLTAKSFEEYNQLMNFGMETMLNPKTGVVQGVGIALWASNPSFYANAKLDVVLERAECYSLTARTCEGKQCMVGGNPENCQTVCYFPSGNNDHAPFDCRNGSICTAANCLSSSGSEQDFSYVQGTEQCEDDTDYNTFATLDDDFVESGIVTTPKESCNDDTSPTYVTEIVEFPPNLKSIIFVENAEHIATTDAIVRQMFTVLESLSQCIGFLNALPENILKINWVVNQRAPIQDSVYDTTVIQLPSATNNRFILSSYTSPLSAAALKIILNGEENSQTGLDKFLYGREVKKFMNYVNGYYSPCINELSGEDMQFSAGKMFVKHWVQIDACAKPLCLIKGTIYNEGDGDCRFENEVFFTENYNPTNQTSYVDVPYAIDTFCQPRLRRAVAGATAPVITNLAAT